MMQGATTLVGSVLSCIILNDIMVVGTKVTPHVLMTKKVIILRLAVSFSLFKVCNDSMAFSPKGVAALPNPNRLAIMFDDIKPSDSCPLGISGKIFDRIGEINFEVFSSNPDFFAMFIMPSQIAKSGNIWIIKSNVVFPLDNIWVFKTSALPSMIKYNEPETMKNIQSLFIMEPSFYFLENVCFFCFFFVDVDALAIYFFITDI